jgi:hypothetical protein
VASPVAGRSFSAAVAQWIHKPLSSYVLAWLASFGPVVAIALFDWRGGLAYLRDHQPVGLLLAICAVLAFVGGSDTERFVFWSAPVILLLVGRGVEHHERILSNRYLLSAIVIAQAIVARVFWPIPDPTEAVASLADASNIYEKVYAVLDRLFVIDSFHYNLWSSFGSVPFRMLRLALYAAATGGLVLVMKNREVSLRTLRDAGDGSKDRRTVE